jgi:hypothetical protein
MHIKYRNIARRGELSVISKSFPDSFQELLIYILIVIYISVSLNMIMIWWQCNVHSDHLHQNIQEKTWLLCAFYKSFHRYRWHLYMSDIFLKDMLNNSYNTQSITNSMLQKTSKTVGGVHSFNSGKALYRYWNIFNIIHIFLRTFTSILLSHLYKMSSYFSFSTPQAFSWYPGDV